MREVHTVAAQHGPHKIKVTDNAKVETGDQILKLPLHTKVGLLTSPSAAIHR